jgi:hypothetical protein
MDLVPNSIRNALRYPRYRVRDLQVRLRAAAHAERQAPAFMIIGAMKAGTTSLFSYLCEHPLVAPPIVKEIHYFDFWSTRPLDWYLAHFPKRAHLPRGAITGEATTGYLAHPAVPGRIAREFPEVRLIALLRDPVARAISHYFHEKRCGHDNRPMRQALLSAEARRPFDLQVEEETAWHEAVLRGAARADAAALLAAHPWHRSYIAQGLYAEQLERWFRFFDRSRVLVLGAEDLFREPAGTYRHALEFLGLEPFDPGTLHPHNVGTYDAEVDPAIVTELAAAFEEPNRRLSRLLGRDFSWTAA